MAHTVVVVVAVRVVLTRRLHLVRFESNSTHPAFKPRHSCSTTDNALDHATAQSFVIAHPAEPHARASALQYLSHCKAKVGIGQVASQLWTAPVVVVVVTVVVVSVVVVAVVVVVVQKKCVFSA